MSELPAVWRVIEVLRDAHRAERIHWRSFANAAPSIPNIPVSQAGAVAHIIGKAARHVVSQLRHAQPASEASLRLTLLHLSDILNNEANAHGCEYPQSYHAKD